MVMPNFSVLIALSPLLWLKGEGSPIEEMH